MRVLAIADEESEALYGEALLDARPDVIVSCGDLPFEYLENLVTRAGVPLLYVLGNHDPAAQPAPATLDLEPAFTALRPEGCDPLDGRVVEVAGLRIAGLSGSLRYRPGPNQYTQGEMRWRALRLEARVRIGRAFGRGPIDVLVTHPPPLGLGDAEDPPHRGFAAFHRLVASLSPRVMVHGHIHPVHRKRADRRLGSTLVVNAIPSRLLEI